MENLTKDQIAESLISHIINKLVEYLMEDYNMSLQDAMYNVYSSDTVKKLENKETELYVQSPAYVYERLIKEKKLLDLGPKT